jgi:hypothetical protein
MAGQDHGVPERHASWIELFFDLFVVAGVGQLAHLLSHGPSFADVGLYLLIFLALWFAWATFMVYGNVEGDRARIPLMLLAMLGLAVMVAAVPSIRPAHRRQMDMAPWLGPARRRGADRCRFGRQRPTDRLVDLADRRDGRVVDRISTDQRSCPVSAGRRPGGRGPSPAHR